MKVYLGHVAMFVCMIVLTGCYSYIGKTKEVVFSGHDGIKLRGTLVFPDDVKTPIPTVILLHGAEKATRSFVYRMHANIFLSRGIAVLLYDKRGAGESEGDYKNLTYAQLVGDAIEAVAFLRRHQDVNPNLIGLVGASESGWFTPEIAERTGRIAFIINKVGPCLSRLETERWEIYNDLLAENISGSSAHKQTEVFHRISVYYLSPTIEERIALEKTLAIWAERKDSKLPKTIVSASDSYISKLGYDPTPYLERLTTPTLYVYGSQDINVPTDACVQRLEKLAVAGKPVSYHVYGGEGHELGSVGIIPPGYRFVRGYAELLGKFAAKHVGLQTVD